MGLIPLVIGALILWWALYSWLHRTEIIVRDEALDFRKGMFSMGEAERLYNYKFKDIQVVHRSTALGKCFYSIVVTLVDDRLKTLATALTGQRDIQSLVDRIKKTLNLMENNR